MSDNGYTSGKVADAIRSGDINALYDAFLTDDKDAGDLLLLLEQAYDPGPEDPQEVEDTPLWQMLSRQTTTDSLRDARQYGDLSTLSAATGITNERFEAGAFALLDVIEELFKPEDRDHMLNLVMYAPPPPVGPTGVGKTDFAYTLIEGAERLHNGLSVASNNTSDPYDNTQSWTQLEDWLEATSGTKVFLLDEASQVLMFSDMNAGKALSNLIKLLRKHECHLILVGHTGKDIPKDIRRMVMFAQKESKKKVTIGAGLEEDSAGWMQIKNVLYRIGDVPATGIKYSSTGDKGSFAFDKDDDGVEPGQEAHTPQCRAETNSGSQCPNDAKYPAENPVVCVNHRHKMDDIQDGEV